MMNLALAIGFGAVAISCIFMVYVFGCIAIDRQVTNSGTRMLATGLAVASSAIAVMAFNRVLIAKYDSELLAIVLLVASILLFLGKIFIMTSTAMGGASSTTLKVFAFVTVGWAAYCVATMA